MDNKSKEPSETSETKVAPKKNQNQNKNQNNNRNNSNRKKTYQRKKRNYRQKRYTKSEPSVSVEENSGPVEKKFLITYEGGETRVALVENGRLEELYVERESANKIYGNIYKAVVKSIVPAIDAAFVDIGTGKDGFLYLHDVKERDPEDDLFYDEMESDKPKQNNEKITLKEGDDITVQVTKEAIRSKGPRLTTKLSVPARYLVLTPGDPHLGISRRISERAERDRIREILTTSRPSDDVGYIARTAAEGKDKKDFIRDIKYLKKVWTDIHKKHKRTKPPGIIHSELKLVERIIRDAFTEDIKEIIVDNKDVYKQVVHFAKIYISDLKPVIKYYREKIPLFTKFGLDQDIETTFMKDVPLKSGGSIVIEQTEGMTAIDVNSGRSTNQDSLEETAFRTNMEAASEIVRQLRLRDMGGIVVIDFIDMHDDRHKRQLMRRLHEVVKRDKAKINILKMSDIGVVEMTRQRIRASKESSVYEKCPHCNSRGLIKSLTTMRIHALKTIRHRVMSLSNKTVTVTLAPDVAELLLETNAKDISDLEKQNRNKIIVLADEGAHREEVEITY